ncbi:alcohol dehydrogenase catalytic domain-containing protein [Streptomyces incanus]|uniref:Alcohol dehydrogenase catalytic domain-containing protein n=1 Tax=Streptomyces incanus TaxID=887453 RepID=A0ABW0Y0S7_9ACTN
MTPCSARTAHGLERHLRPAQEVGGHLRGHCLPIDWKILHGFMRQVMPVDLPGGLGSDAAGAVDQGGEGVTAFSLGDEVLGGLSCPLCARSALADPAAPVARPSSVPASSHSWPSTPRAPSRTLPRPHAAAGAVRVRRCRPVQAHRTEPGAEGPEALGDILALIGAGQLQMPVASPHPLDEVAAAPAVSQSGSTERQARSTPGGEPGPA